MRIARGLATAVAALAGMAAQANSTGITGRSGNPITGGSTCAACHSGGGFGYNAPAIAGATTVAAASVNSYTLDFTASGSEAVRAGFNLSATGGTLSDPDTGDNTVQKIGLELTHGAPRVPSGGNFSWTFGWTAPAQAGNYTFYVCSNPVNSNGSNSGDGPIRCSSTRLCVTTPGSAAPVAADDGYTAAVNGSRTVTAPGVLANDTDVNCDALTAVLVTGPNGTLSLAPDGGFTYTPAAGFSGVDSFTYQAFDGSASSNTATVTITVSAPPSSGGGGGGGAPAPMLLSLFALAAYLRGLKASKRRAISP